MLVSMAETNPFLFPRAGDRIFLLKSMWIQGGGQLPIHNLWPV